MRSNEEVKELWEEKYYQRYPEYRRKNDLRGLARDAEQWTKTHFEKIKEYEARRKRLELGFIPLNEYFDGSQFHHLTKDLGLYIPKSLHRGISHCLKTGKNMTVINDLAIQYFEETL